jgi:hypothetical protein
MKAVMGSSNLPLLVFYFSYTAALSRVHGARVLRLRSFSFPSPGGCPVGDGVGGKRDRPDKKIRKKKKATILLLYGTVALCTRVQPQV